MKLSFTYLLKFWNIFESSDTYLQKLWNNLLIGLSSCENFEKNNLSDEFKKNILGEDYRFKIELVKNKILRGVIKGGALWLELQYLIEL